MSATVLDIFDRFLARIPSHGAGVLRTEEALRAEASDLLRAPLCSVLLKGREAGRDEPLAVLVLTVPTLAADHTSLLDLAARKARAHKAPYFVTWTLRKACLWETPRPGTPEARDQVTKLRDYPEVFEVPAVSADLPEPARIAVLESSKAILNDLESLFRNQALDQVQIDATYFVRRLLDAVQHLLPLVTDSLHLRLESDSAFREDMAVWAVKQGIAGDPRDVDFARSIARQIVYRLLGKVLFYHSLRRSARHLPDLDFRGADTSEVLPNLRRAFARALEIDYHAVFAEDLPDRVAWPADASRELAALIHDFHTRDFSHVPQDVIGTVFERLIPPEERHGLGQYFTPENLCDLVLAFCVRSPTDTVLDPTCGTGTFLIRAYDRLRALGRYDHGALLSQLWGVDIAPFPAELATINLFRQRVAEHGNFPRILCRDFFSISPGQRFPFPPPKMDPVHPETQEHEFPQFDAIVGNFPFIRQEKIEKLVPGYKAELEKVIADGWFETYPEAFAFPSKRIDRRFQQLRKLNQPTAEYKTHAELRLSGKADMLAYLFFQAARFVRPGGRMGIITSNAWLDVDYGYELQRFLLDNFKVVAILESRCEPWFTEADVYPRCSEFTYNTSKELTSILLPSVSRGVPGRCPMKSIHLDAAHRSELEGRRHTTHDKRIYERLSAVLWVAEGKTRSEVATLLGCSVRQLAEWLRLFRNKGLEALCTLHNDGDPGNLTAAQIVRLKQEVSTGRFRNSDQIRQWLEETFGVTYKPSGVKDLLRRIGVSYHKVTGFLWKAKPEKQREFVRKYHRQRGAAHRPGARQTRFYFVDACHPIWGLDLVYSCWLLVGQRLLAGMGSGRKRLNILGAYCPDDHEYLDMRLTRDNINGEQFVNLLRLLRTTHPEVERFVLYVDGARYYGAPVVKDWLRRHPEFHLEPLPPYSPNLNLIERLWKFLRQRALSRWHKTFEAMQQAVAEVLDHLETYRGELDTLMVEKFHIVPESEIPVEYREAA